MGENCIGNNQQSSRGIFRYLTGTLEGKEKRTLHICLIFFFFSPIVDLFSISVIIPVLRQAAEQGVSKRLVIQIVGLGVIFLLKGGFELLKVKMSNGFLKDTASAWSVKFYELFSKEELLEHNQKTVLQQITGIRTDTEVCADMIIAFINLIVYAVTMIGFFSLTVYVAQGIGAVIFLLAAILLVLLFLRCRRQILQCGIQKRKSEIKTAALISAVYGAYKEIRIDSRSKYLLNKYAQASKEYAKVQKDYMFMTERLGILLQNMVQAAIFFSLPVVLALGVELSAFWADIVVFITILTQMLSKAVAMMSAANRIQYGKKNYEIFHENMERYRRQKQKEKAMSVVRKKQITLTKGIRIENLTFRYPEGEDILKDASIEIPAGCSVAIIGPSGAGKTTFLDLILGLLKPQSGYIWYDDYELVEGKDMDGTCKGELGSIVSYIPQVMYLNGDTIRNNIVFMDEGEGDEERIISCLKNAQIWEDIKKLPNGIDTLIGENGTAISEGQRQRIALARAMYKKFKLLIMDEATAALDMETEEAVMNTIYHMGEHKTLLIVTHHLNLADGCERVYRIENKKFVRVR